MNRIFCCTLPRSLGAGLSLVVLAAAFGIAPPINGAEPRCVAHWRFQNGVKGTVAGPSHLIEDCSGNNQHGMAFGRPRFQRVDAPHNNLGLVFSGNEDRVFVPDDVAFQLTNSFTIEACIRVDRCPDAAIGYVVFRGDDRPGLNPWSFGIKNTGQLTFLVTNDVDQSTGVQTTGPVALGKLMHVAGTLNDLTGELSLFVDGERVATRSTNVRAGGVLGGPNPGVGIGNLQTAGDDGFRGLIADVRITAAALVPEEFLPVPRAR